MECLQKDASVPLAADERRLLRELASPDSFADIAQRLGSSRESIKSHAIALYLKLGVVSRAEAIDAAHTARLLPQPANRV